MHRIVWHIYQEVILFFKYEYWSEKSIWVQCSIYANADWYLMIIILILQFQWHMSALIMSTLIDVSQNCSIKYIYPELFMLKLQDLDSRCLSKLCQCCTQT